MLKHKLIFVLLFSLTLSGCPSENTKVDSAEGAAKTESQPTPEAEVKNEFKIGETFQNGDLKITLNGIRYTKTINETNNQFQVKSAEKGHTFAIADFTVENIGKEQKVFSMALAAPKMVDKDGYSVESDFETSMYLKKKFNDGGAIQPAGKIRGEISFNIEESKKGLKLSITPEIGAQTAFYQVN